MAYRKDSGSMRSVRLLGLVATLLVTGMIIALGGCSDDCPTDATAPQSLILPDGSGTHPTIQAAIDAAAGGDTLRLADGIFRGDGNRDLDFGGKDLVLCSASGNPAMCVINCEGSAAAPHRGILLHTGETLAATIEGITITGGQVSSDGGCIRIDNRSAATLQNLVLSHGTADAGGALACAHGSSANISDCLFEFNTADIGGAIVCDGCATTIRQCTFRSNEGRVGGALALARETLPGNVIEGCLFEINQGTFGGAVFLREVTSVLTNCMFQQNFAGEGGALHFEIASPVLIGCTSYANVARSNGGTLYCLGDCEPRFEQCTVCFDVCLSEGSAFMLNSTGTAQFTRCIVYRCMGGPAFSYGEEHRPVLTCCDLNANEGGDWTEGIEDQLGVDGNVSLWPFFCDEFQADFRLHSSSPCTEGESECGRMGAWGEGCE